MASSDSLELEARNAEALRAELDERARNDPAFRTRRFITLLGELIQDARELSGATQVEIAERAGITPTYLSRLENGLLTRGATASALLQVFEGLECSLEISIRSKTGQLVGSLNSQQLSRRDAKMFDMEGIGRDYVLHETLSADRSALYSQVIGQDAYKGGAVKIQSVTVNVPIAATRKR